MNKERTTQPTHPAKPGFIWAFTNQSGWYQKRDTSQDSKKRPTGLDDGKKYSSFMKGLEGKEEKQKMIFIKTSLDQDKELRNITLQKFLVNNNLTDRISSPEQFDNSLIKIFGYQNLEKGLNNFFLNKNSEELISYQTQGKFAYINPEEKGIIFVDSEQVREIGE